MSTVLNSKLSPLLKRVMKVSVTMPFKLKFSLNKAGVLVLNNAYRAQLKALSLVKKTTFVNQGSCDEAPSTNILKRNEIFTVGFLEMLKDFAHKRQVKRIGPSLPFNSLVNAVDSEDITKERIRTQESTLEINNVDTSLSPSNTDTETPH